MMCIQLVPYSSDDLYLFPPIYFEYFHLPINKMCFLFDLQSEIIISEDETRRSFNFTVNDLEPESSYDFRVGV